MASKKREYPLIAPFIFSWILLVVSTLIFFLLINKLPPEVPLFYGQAQANKQIVPKNYLLIPLATAFIFTLINYGLVRTLKDKFLILVVATLTIFISLMATIAVIKVIFLIGNI